MITDFDQLDLTKQYTYADYLTWKFKERVELLRGWVVKMSPPPNRRHQLISLRIEKKIDKCLKDRCQMYHAPFDVVLSNEDKSTVVQPDICVICDERKLTDQGCTGAPEMIIEILSPGNTQNEYRDKYELYEENGVQEYWIVNPMENTIISYTLKSEKFIGSKFYVPGESITSKVLPDLIIELETVFA